MGGLACTRLVILRVTILVCLVNSSSFGHDSSVSKSRSCWRREAGKRAGVIRCTAGS
jgi:hypothetical protein